MKLRIIDGCVEINNKIFNVGDIIECDNNRGKALINKGYCVEITNQIHRNQIETIKDNTTIAPEVEELEQEVSVNELFE